jgi:hypothetical protein
MYSPKVSEELVPVLYRLAKDRRMPMTRFVDGIIRQALASNNLPLGKSAASLPVTHEVSAVLRPAVAA